MRLLEGEIKVEHMSAHVDARELGQHLSLSQKLVLIVRGISLRLQGALLRIFDVCVGVVLEVLLTI